MAKKRQAQNHSKRLADAMKSIYTASTPLSSILPIQDRVEVSGTSQAARSKGTKNPSGSQMPQKLLLQITDPGSAPSAPKAVLNPGTLVSPNFAAYMPKGQTPASYGKGGFDKNSKSYLSDIAAFNLASSRYQNYTIALKAYQQNLTNYNTAVAQRDADTATNTARTTQYQKDLANFFSSARGGRTGSKRRATVRKGSRNSAGGSSNVQSRSRGSR
tara:strand:- start:105 stop:752 length:648 start_codon:yes stop_codon:yes gene_type:complete